MTPEERAESYRARGAKISASLTGKKLSPEHVENMSKGLRGRKQSPEEIAHRAESNRGRKRTPEARLRMSEGNKASWTEERRSHHSEMYMSKRFGGEDAAGEYLSHGYRMITGVWDHPLATSNGAVGEHRLILYDEIGPGPHRCHWCNKTVEWKSPERGMDLCADHLDGDTLNNDPGNLVPSCFKCNWDRGKE